MILTIKIDIDSAFYRHLFKKEKSMRIFQNSIPVMKSRASISILSIADGVKSGLGTAATWYFDSEYEKIKKAEQ